MRVDSAPHRQFRSSRRAVAPPLRPVQRGVTLMEVMIVLAIVAIVLAVGVPGLREFAARNRLDGAAQDLLASLQYARSEAMRRGLEVTTFRCEPSPGVRNWTGGWTMWFDLPAANIPTPCNYCDPDQPTKNDPRCLKQLRRGMPLASPMTSVSNVFDTIIVIDREGRLSGAGGGYFVLCEDEDRKGELRKDGHWRSRAVLVNGTGRVRMAARDDGRGVLLTDSGEIGDCGKP